MARRRKTDPKLEALRDQGILNPRPKRVSDSLFAESNFFDPRDLVQVKYEMVRRVEVDGTSVTGAAAAFGFSRPSFYQAQRALREGGLAGLLPKKRGPHSGHKLNAEVVAFIEKLQSEVALKIGEMVQHVEDRFGIRVHPRSIERALARQEKKRR